MQTRFQHPVRLLWHVECFGDWTCRVCLTESAADWRKGGWRHRSHPFVAGRVFSSSLKNTTVSPTRRGREGVNGETCVICTVGMGSGWVWRSVTWPTIGCCVILKVFLGEYNGPFREHPMPWSSSLAPEVLHFMGRTAAQLCLSSLAF